MLSTTELRHRLRSVPSHVLQVCSDRLLNIATQPDSEAEQAMAEQFENHRNRDYRTRFQSANYLYLHRIAEVVKPEVPGRSVFYDLGCGKGRALCVMARHPFKKVVGVELRAELCECARDNAERLRGRVAPIEVVQGDATQAEFADGDVYFFYNPFGAPTFTKVLRNLERSFERAPRPLTLVYYNALHEDLLDGCPWLERYHELPTFSGVPVGFWRSV
jgi:SAM-dependent methyltransferase